MSMGTRSEKPMGKLFHSRRSKIAVARHCSICLFYFLSFLSLGACGNLNSVSAYRERSDHALPLKQLSEKQSSESPQTISASSKTLLSGITSNFSISSKNPGVAQSVNAMASLMTLEGNYSEKIADAISKMEKSNQPGGVKLEQLNVSDKDKDVAKGKVVSESIALGLNNLANLYAAQGNYKQAEPLFERALSILEQTFGTNHISLLPVLDDYGALLDKTGQTNKANQMHARATLIRQPLMQKQ